MASARSAEERRGRLLQPGRSRFGNFHGLRRKGEAGQIFDRLPVFWASDPDFEARKIGAAHMIHYGLNPPVTARAASLGNANPGERQIEVVMDDQHPSGGMEKYLRSSPTASPLLFI